MTSTNEKLIARNEALKQVVEHNRDYLSCNISLPLGNPALKEVHTNQWLFTELPAEFDLANWTVLADALNANTNRHEKYIENRWYIDGVDISVKGNEGTMELSLNAFPSSFNSYSESARQMQKAYQDAGKQKTSKKNTSKKNTTKAVAKKVSVINEQWVKKYNISSTIVNQVKKICKAGAGDYNNVRALFKWCDAHLPYEGYSNTRYGAVGTLKRGRGNCVDHAHLFVAMCRSIGVKCNYIHNSCIKHVYNKVYINGKGVIVDTGRDCASWGSHWGSGGCPTEKTSITF